MQTKVNKTKYLPLLKQLSLSVLFLIMIMVVAGCAEQKEVASNKGKVKVTTTVGMITDIVKNVGGDYVEVTGLMGEGVDPHLYKASQGDIKKLDHADIIFYNGLHLEGKMVEIFEKMAADKPTFAVSADLDESRLRSGKDAGGTEHDPHIWFNVKNWISATEKVRDELVAYDAAHEEDYKRLAAEYIKKLEELDNYAMEQISSIPEQSRVLVTAHDAFGYFGDAYHIKVMGLQGMSTASEYGSKDVSTLRDYLVKTKVKAVFIESSVPRKSIDAVIEGAKQQGHDIVVGGELFSDAMGKEGTSEGTYIGMVRHNVDTIVNALK